MSRTSAVSSWFPPSISLVLSPVLHAGPRAIGNVHDMNGVSQGDVEEFVEPELTDEPVKLAVDASQSRSKSITMAATYRQFSKDAASIIKWHRTQQGKGMRHTTRKKVDLKLERGIIHTVDGCPIAETTLGIRLSDGVCNIVLSWASEACL